MARTKARTRKIAGKRTLLKRGHRSADDFLIAQRYLSADGRVDIDVVAAELAITKRALAQSLGFAEETLQRFSRKAAPKTQQRLREMLEILMRVEPWAGGMPQAIGWYRGQSIPALGDQTAEALVKMDQAGIVRAYLDGLAAGSYA
jgi:DNA-binding Xre family transcriptional regulator